MVQQNSQKGSGGSRYAVYVAAHVATCRGRIDGHRDPSGPK